MGTGTPTVTTEGLTAANAVLKRRGVERFVHRPGMKQYVRIVENPFTRDKLFLGDEPEMRVARLESMRCRLCENPTCAKPEALDVRGIMRRVSVGNFAGAKKSLQKSGLKLTDFGECEKRCIRTLEGGRPVAISKVLKFVRAPL